MLNEPTQGAESGAFIYSCHPGLSITSGIVEDYGGKIHIDSQEGQGTTFYLSFPVVQ